MATTSRTVVLDKDIVRFDRHQIIQHILLAVSFTLLALTGLPMKFHGWGVSQWWMGVWGGIDVLRGVHRFAAYLMVFDCIYHVAYICYGLFVLKKPFPYKMLPAVTDFRDFLQEMGYFVGLVKKRPMYDRFNWREKFDYWAIFRGLPVIGISGFIMMYPVLATKVLPGWIVPAAFVAHGDEAVLAVVWIAVVHLVFNHLAPRVFPLNASIFTGKVNKERYKHEHPLEYERLAASGELEWVPETEPAEPPELIQEEPVAESVLPAAPGRGRLRDLFSDAVVASGGALVIFTIVLLLIILIASLPGGNPYAGVFLFVLLPVVAIGGFLIFLFGVVMRRRKVEPQDEEESSVE